MVLNYIWIGFFVVAFIIALVKVIFLGDTEIFTAIMNATFDSSKTAFEISLGLTGVLALWLGIMKIGENSGLIGTESNERAAGTESEKGHCFQSDDYVFGD